MKNTNFYNTDENMTIAMKINNYDLILEEVSYIYYVHAHVASNSGIACFL